MLGYLRTFALCGALCCIFASSFALAATPVDDKKPASDSGKDVLVFTNGDQLTGHFEQATDGKVTFKSDMAGEITVEWAKIKELRAAGTYAVIRKSKPLNSRHINDAEIPKGAVTVADNQLTVQTAGAQPQVIPIPDAQYVVTQQSYDKDIRGNPGFFSDWKGIVQAGASVVRSTQDSQNITAGISLVRVVPPVGWLNPRYRDQIDFSGTFGKVTQPATTTVPESTVTTNIFHADAEHDMYLTTRVYALANTAFDHNYAQGLALQQIYGGGIGWTVNKTAQQELDVKAQVQYEQQSFSVVPGGLPPAAPTNDLIASTFAENYMRKFKNKIILTEQIQYIPAWNNTSAYSGLAQVGVAMPLWKNFNFSVGVIDNYLNDPAPGANKNSFQAMTGLQYTLK
jgi:hypothetical protein